MGSAPFACAPEKVAEKAKSNRSEFAVEVHVGSVVSRIIYALVSLSRHEASLIAPNRNVGSTTVAFAIVRQCSTTRSRLIAAVGSRGLLCGRAVPPVPPVPLAWLAL